MPSPPGTNVAQSHRRIEKMAGMAMAKRMMSLGVHFIVMSPCQFGKGGRRRDPSFVATGPGFI